ncbi:hypothetical protein EPK97_20935 [Chengkuizengella sediminis]|nr:hypothetical protein [Chengkuizengella sediminis]
MAQEVFLDAMDVLNKYIKIAFADITDFITFFRKDIVTGEVEALLNSDLSVKDIIPMLKSSNEVYFKDMDQVDGSMISEVKKSKDGISIKLHDKIMEALISDTDNTNFLSEEPMWSDFAKILYASVCMKFGFLKEYMMICHLLIPPHLLIKGVFFIDRAAYPIYTQTLNFEIDWRFFELIQKVKFIRKNTRN